MRQKSLREQGGIWLFWTGGVRQLFTGNQSRLGQVHLFQMIIPGFGRVLALWLLLFSWRVEETGELKGVLLELDKVNV